MCFCGSICWVGVWVWVGVRVGFWVGGFGVGLRFVLVGIGLDSGVCGGLRCRVWIGFGVCRVRVRLRFGLGRVRLGWVES